MDIPTTYSEDWIGIGILDSRIFLVLLHLHYLGYNCSVGSVDFKVFDGWGIFIIKVGFVVSKYLNIMK